MTDVMRRFNSVDDTTCVAQRSHTHTSNGRRGLVSIPARRTPNKKTGGTLTGPSGVAIREVLDVRSVRVCEQLDGSINAACLFRSSFTIDSPSVNHRARKKPKISSIRYFPF